MSIIGAAAAAGGYQKNEHFDAETELKAFMLDAGPAISRPMGEIYRVDGLPRGGKKLAVVR